MNGCAPGLALRERLKATLKWAIDAWFQRVYQKALSLSELVGGSEERPHVCSCTVLETNGGTNSP